MSYNINVDKAIEELDKTLNMVSRELASWGTVKFTPGTESGIKMWTLIGVKMAIEHMREALSVSKERVDDEPGGSRSREDQESGGKNGGVDERGRKSKRHGEPRDGESGEDNSLVD